MTKILKFNEFVLEGVADKMASKRFGIPDPDEEFEKHFKNSKLENNIIGKIKNTDIVKNPINLNNIEYGVRGIITKNGDLYIASSMSEVIHIDILIFLKSKGIVTESPTGWDNLFKNTPNEFIAIQRVWNKNIMAISESYTIPKRGEEKEKTLKLFIPYLNKCKLKNKEIDFVSLQIRTAIRQYLNEHEKREWSIKGSGS